METVDNCQDLWTAYAQHMDGKERHPHVAHNLPTGPKRQLPTVSTPPVAAVIPSIPFMD